MRHMPVTESRGSRWQGHFKDNDTAVTWAALAEECGLSTLLANAKLFMVKNADPEFWQSPV